MADTIGSIKSTAGVINHVSDAINKAIVGSSEMLPTSPTSFVNTLLDQIGSISSAKFFEMLSIKQETNKSTAKLRRSLVRYLNSTEFVGILGSPSSFTFSLGFSLTDLVQYGAIDIPNLTQKVTINQGTLIPLLDKPPFTLDHSIDITIKRKFVFDVNTNTADPANYTFYAQYLLDTSKVIPSISNAFVKSYIITEGGLPYFMMEIVTRQYVRNETIITSINTSTMQYEYDIPYSDELYAFEVFYKENDNVDYVWLQGQPDGVFNGNGYNFVLRDRTTGASSLVVKFHRDPTKFTIANGSTIKIVVYTTQGSKGNFILTNWNTATAPITNINFIQDRTIQAEDAIFSITPAIALNGPEASGGSDEMTIDDLRTFVITKSDSKNITLVELQALALKQNMKLTKERFDILQIYFRLIGYVEDSGIQITTTPGFVSLNIDLLPYSDAVEMYILTPQNFMIPDSNYKFSIDGSIKNNNLSESTNYIRNYNNKVTTVRHYFFPYFMKLNMGSYVDSKVYDMSANDSYPTLFEHFNQSSTSIAGISSCTVYRDPMNTVTEIISTNANGKITYAGKYRISFSMQISALMYANLFDVNGNIVPNQMNMFINLVGPSASYLVSNDTNHIIIKPLSAKDGVVSVTVILDTDNGIDDYDRLHLINSVVPFPTITSPSSDYFIDSIVDMNVFVGFAGTVPDGWTGYTTVDTTIPLSAAYRVKDINLYTNITDLIKPTLDVKIDPTSVYKVYENNVQAKYTTTIVAKNSDGTDILHSESVLVAGVPTTIQVPEILHQKGDFIFDTDGITPIWAHLKGEIILYDALGNIVDEGGQPELADSYYPTLIEAIDLPLVDRIHSFGSGYNTTRSAFNSLRNRISALMNYAPTGSTAKLGVFNTIGSGNYYFFNRNLGNIKTPLDRMALSFTVGISLEDSTIDQVTTTSAVVTAIVNYIRANSTASFVSFVEMMDYVKTTVVGIKYYEIYSVNDYPNGACQSITLNTSATSNNGIITIKNVVDLDNSDIANDIIVFKPDISVSII